MITSLELLYTAIYHALTMNMLCAKFTVTNIGSPACSYYLVQL